MFSLHKQPSRGVLRKNCSENKQQIYRRTPMSKCDLNKVALQPKPHFGMGVQICSIFSEHLFLRTPLEGCFCLFTKQIHFQSQNQNLRTNLLNMFKVTKKNTRLTSLYIALVSLLLTFRIQLVLIWCFAINFEYLIPFRS